MYLPGSHMVTTMIYDPYHTIRSVVGVRLGHMEGNGVAKHLRFGVVRLHIPGNLRFADVA